MTQSITFKFPLISMIRHKKTNGLYLVLIGPDSGRLEASNTPAYSYIGCDDAGRITGNEVWHRCQDEMEDGRFELVEPVQPVQQNYE